MKTPCTAILKILERPLEPLLYAALRHLPTGRRMIANRNTIIVAAAWANHYASKKEPTNG